MEERNPKYIKSSYKKEEREEFIYPGFLSKYSVGLTRIKEEEELHGCAMFETPFFVLSSIKYPLKWGTKLGWDENFKARALRKIKLWGISYKQRLFNYTKNKPLHVVIVNSDKLHRDPHTNAARDMGKRLHNEIRSEVFGSLTDNEKIQEVFSLTYVIDQCIVTAFVFNKPVALGKLNDESPHQIQSLLTVNEFVENWLSNIHPEILNYVGTPNGPHAIPENSAQVKFIISKPQSIDITKLRCNVAFLYHVIVYLQDFSSYITKEINELLAGTPEKPTITRSHIDIAESTPETPQIGFDEKANLFDSVYHDSQVALLEIVENFYRGYAGTQVTWKCWISLPMRDRKEIEKITKEFSEWKAVLPSMESQERPKVVHLSVEETEDIRTVDNVDFEVAELYERDQVLQDFISKILQIQNFQEVFAPECDIFKLRSKQARNFVRYLCLHFMFIERLNIAIEAAQSTLEEQTRELTKFFSKCFNPNHVKVNLLILSGCSNSGKTWISDKLNCILQALNGVVQGNYIDANFVRISKLSLRFLRIVEEYKGNILEDFHHLEANGKQLCKNNASLDNRIALVIVNCDKTNFQLTACREDLRRKRLAKSQDYEMETIIYNETESLRQQVENRSVIFNLATPHWEEFKKIGHQLTAIGEALTKSIRNCEVSHRVTTDSHIYKKWNKVGCDTMDYTTWIMFIASVTPWLVTVHEALEVVNRERNGVNDDIFEMLGKREFGLF